MHHDHDIRAARECLAIARLLVAAVAQILVMNEGDQAQFQREFGGAVLTAVINKDDLIDELVRQIAVGSFQSLRRVVRRHYDYNFLAVQHTVTSRPKIIYSLLGS